MKKSSRNPEFKDANLELLIRRAINKTAGKITDGDMMNIEELYIQKSDITDISGIERCVNLKILDLSFNDISDISMISGLINLENLEMSSNKISDITALHELVNLKRVIINATQVKDISALSKLKTSGKAVCGKYPD